MVLGCSTADRLPSQGPAPPKYIRGFFFGAGVLMVAVRTGESMHDNPFQGPGLACSSAGIPADGPPSKHLQ